ncbi:hypothetical protein AAC387_Pa05g2089 [Persea americana]
MRFPYPDYIPITTTPFPAGVVENGIARELSGTSTVVTDLRFPATARSKKAKERRRGNPDVHERCSITF